MFVTKRQCSCVWSPRMVSGAPQPQGSNMPADGWNGLGE